MSVTPLFIFQNGSGTVYLLPPTILQLQDAAFDAWTVPEVWDSSLESIEALLPIARRDSRGSAGRTFVRYVRMFPRDIDFILVINSWVVAVCKEKTMLFTKR